MKTSGAHTQPSLTPVVHVTFGTDVFSQSLSRLRYSAKRFGIRNIRIYRPDHPVICRAFDENPQIMRLGRGAGYWMWKPYILLDTMDNVAEGTIIIYTDAGQRYIAEPSPIIELAARQDVVLFHNNAGFLQRTWTKRDCFVLLRADAAEYWDAWQLDASIQVYRAGVEARSFLVELQNAMRDPRILCDGPNTCGLPDFDNFRDHRHDQSILTILAIKHRLETFPSPKVAVKKDPTKAGRRAVGKRPAMPRKRPVIFEHHRCRNETLRIYWRRLVDEFLGLT